MRHQRKQATRSTPRSWTVGAGLLWLVAVAVQPAYAQVAKPTTTQPTQEAYWLRVTAERVNVRSRPDANSLTVAVLERDVVLRAVGSEFGWHCIQPPEGVFSLVSARYIERTSEQVGVVAVGSGTLRVRVGSLVFPKVDPLKREVQVRLRRGAEVRILGKQDGWLKIAPPEGVYVYVADGHVARVSADVAARLRKLRPTASRPADTRKKEVAEKQRPTTSQPDLSGKWGQRLRLVEATIQAEAHKPALEQSWTEAIASLRPIAAQREEPAVATLAAAWITRLEQRIADQTMLRAARELAHRTAREKAQAKQELERIRRARREPTSREAFAAVGVLLSSYVTGDKADTPRYKLQNPLTGRVTAYVEFPSQAGIEPRTYAGKYVGVHGTSEKRAELGVALIRVTGITVLDRRRPTSRPAREKPGG